MSKSLDVKGVKQLLNFVEKECREYDTTELYRSILPMHGNDLSKFIKLRLFIQIDNQKEILKFFSHKRNKSAIKKRLIMIINSIITNKRNNDLYEIEHKDIFLGVKSYVGAMKFHSQDNVRIICRDYNPLNEINIVMIEAFKKQGNTNVEDSSYNNRLKSAIKLKHYYKEKDTEKIIYIS